MIRIDPNSDLCPCESGSLVRDCCLGPDGTLRTTPSITEPPPPKTGLSNPGCYASRLADCSQVLSREHPVSHGILKELSHDGLVKIEGFNWQEQNSAQEVPTPRLVSKILCKRHNEALSRIDAIALRLFQKVDNAIRQKQRQPCAFLFDGTDFERWMLKTLCGLVLSGYADIGAVGTSWKPDIRWLGILFAGEPFPDRWGFYYSGESGATIEGGVKFRTIANSEDGVYGLEILLDDERFLFLMDTPPEDLSGTYLARYVYRPKQIVLLNEYCENVIRFGWNDRFEHQMPGVVKYERSGQITLL
jgi:hypothetical protein